jgi:hypothetical protein
VEIGRNLTTILVRKMNLEQIKNTVSSKCDTMLDEVIEKTITKLKHRHSRSLNPYSKKDGTVCSCDYCEYINKEYMPEKQQLQGLKRYYSRYEYADDCETYYRCERGDSDLGEMKKIVDCLKVMKSHYKKMIEEL